MGINEFLPDLRPLPPKEIPKQVDRQENVGHLQSGKATYKFTRPNGDLPQRTSLITWLKTILFNRPSPLIGHDRQLAETAQSIEANLNNIQQGIDNAKRKIHQINREVDQKGSEIAELETKITNNRAFLSKSMEQLLKKRTEQKELILLRQSLIETIQIRRREWRTAKEGLSAFKKELEGTEVKKYRWITMRKISLHESKIAKSFSEFENNYTLYMQGPQLKKAEVRLQEIQKFLNKMKIPAYVDLPPLKHGQIRQMDLELQNIIAYAAKQMEDAEQNHKFEPGFGRYYNKLGALKHEAGEIKKELDRRLH